MSETEVAATGGTSRKLIWGLVALVGLLLLAVVALVFLQVGRSQGDADVVAGPSVTPSPSDSPSEGASPSATPEAEPNEPAEDTGTRFTSFVAPTETVCDAGDEDNQPPKPEIIVSWASANAVEAWYSPSDEDAKDDNYMQIPLSGNQNDLTDEHLFPCFHETEHDYTITLVGPNGEHVSRTWTVTNVGDQ